MTTEAVHTRKRLIKVQPTSEVAWETFTQELAVALEALQEDEFLVLMVKQKNYFVQFAAQGSFGMRAEAVSNLYLPDDKHLSPEQSAGMLELGWNGPTNLPDELEPGGMKADGSPNYFIDAARPAPFDVLAQMATSALREIFQAGHPGNLAYRAMNRTGETIRFPSLGIRQRVE